MIDYTKFPIGISINTDIDSNSWTIHNKLDKNIEVSVSVLLSPGHDLTLPYEHLLFGKESRVAVEISEENPSCE